jgi:HPt (histidine-containing phosphotransfer) domain-containing protein
MAHKAKSSVAVMGMRDVADLLKDLEILADKAEELDRCESLVNEFLKQSELAVLELENSY